MKHLRLSIAIDLMQENQIREDLTQGYFNKGGLYWSVNTVGSAMITITIGLRCSEKEGEQKANHMANLARLLFIKSMDN